MTEDRRQYARVATLRFVKFMVGGRTYHGTIENMGNGGVFIKTEEHFSVGQQISMTYESTIFIKKEKTGSIAWVGPQGMGVKFKDPA